MATAKTKTPVEKALEAAEAPKPKRLFIISETRVDSRNVVRRRVLLTPAVCEECGFDFLYANDLAPWDSLSPKEREKAKEAIQEHKDEYHGKENKLILEEDEVPTSWLGKPKRKPKRLI